MAVNITKEGPFFASGAIRWSDYRTNFKRTGSGPVSASEMIRETSTSVADPIMPDATENSGVPSSGAIDASDIRNSIKWYYVDITGSNSQYDISTASWNSNYNKNLRKFIRLKGTFFSNAIGTAGARTGGTSFNNTLEVTGTIRGAGGDGGSPAANGQDAGDAFHINGGTGHRVQITGSGRIWAGGGGGGGGGTGSAGSNGTCRRQYNIQGCNGLPACSPGSLISQSSGGCCETIRYCGGPWESFCWHECWGAWQYGTCRHDINSNTPGTKAGGSGGDGQGNQQNRTNGGSGVSGECPTCTSPYVYQNDGTCSGDGGTGGNGGDWGENGQNGSGTSPGSGGDAGAAIHDPQTASYSVTGNNSTSVKGAI